MAGASIGRELDQTPTWAVALVCAIIVLISIILEKVLHAVGHWFHERQKSALVEALEKIKAELMVLGFISLLLTFGQNYIVKVCIPDSLANTMLPCPKHGPGPAHGAPPAGEHKTMAPPAGEHKTIGPPAGEHETIKPPAGEHETIKPPAGEHETIKPPAGEKTPIKPPGAESHRRLLWYDHHRILAADSAAKGCKPGYVPLISTNGLHQLHIFIFFLAVFHVNYSGLTMTLGRAKIRAWKFWEREIAEQQQVQNDPSRFRLTHEDSFVKSHTNFWTTTPFLFPIVCFFRQFFRAVTKADYMTMRHGFVSVHLLPGSQFNFQKYIKRSLEDDFKVLVGISPVLWGSAVIYLLVNVHGWQTMFWLSIMPLVVILAVGTKLQAIITQMAVEIQERHAVVQGIPLVQVSDRHFWFSWPSLILYLIQLTLFQNAFEITYFVWIWYEFGMYSCFNENPKLQYVRIILGIGAQILCSYSTLPLYALVTQMGSTMKKSIFDDQTAKALKNWQKHAMKKKDGKPAPMPTRTLGGSGSGSGAGSVELHHRGGSAHDNEDSSAHIVASVDIDSDNHRKQSGTPDLL